MVGPRPDGLFPMYPSTGSTFGQRTDHLLRSLGELLKDSEGDVAGPQDRNPAAGTKKHLEWDSSPAPLQTEAL